MQSPAFLLHSKLLSDSEIKLGIFLFSDNKIEEFK